MDQAQRIHPANHRPRPFIGSLVDPLLCAMLDPPYHCKSGSWFVCRVGRTDMGSSQ